MPYPPEYRCETRAQIVRSARKLFKCHGFLAVSIDDIMAPVGSPFSPTRPGP